MRRVLALGSLGLLAFVALSLSVAARASAQVSSPTSQTAAQSIEIPTIPDPARVTLDPTTTAFLALDFQQSNCGTRPPCVASLPAVSAGLAAARAANALVVYSQTPGGVILPDVAPMPSDPIVTSSADKFFNTDLDTILKQAGVNTVVITGTSSNGAVLYTAFAASERGYTVVVAEDGISASTDFATFLTEWQLLNGPGTSNPQNTPLQAKAVTLSRTDLITYK